MKASGQRAEPDGLLDPQLLELFGKLAEMPDLCQDLLGRLIGDIAARIQAREAEGFEVRSAGPERLLLLMQLKERLPAIAQSKRLAKAFKESLLLNRLGQTALCFSMAEPINLVELYLGVCEKHDTAPEASQVEAIVHTCLTQGVEEGRAVLKILMRRR